VGLTIFHKLPVVAFALAILTGAHLDAAEPTAFSVQLTGKGAPVIFIPGFTCPGSVWDTTVDAIKADHECHVITIAGFAGVPASGVEPILAGVRDQLISYIKDKQLNHPVIVGHSMGGFLALWLAEKEPTIISKLVVLDILPFYGIYLKPDADSENIKPIAETFRSRMQNATQAEFGEQNSQFLRSMISSPEQATRLSEQTGKSDPKVAGAAYYELLTTDLRPDLNKIQSPVLVVTALGAKPDGVTDEQAKEFIQTQYANLKQADFTFFENARHFVFFDDPGKWIDVLKTALK
jgi:N-formylmaleamate deformylase